MLVPLRVDVPTDRRPYVNIAIIAVTVVASVYGFYDHEFFRHWAGIAVTFEGVYPFVRNVQVHLSSADLPQPVLAITSSVLHAGWFHLLGNMLFLWVFGNAINYKFGHVRFLALYLIAALVSGMAHYGFTNDPFVGASGAIYGVMGAFLVFFPRNDVTIFWVIWIRPGVSRISSMWLIALWVAWDLLFAILGVETGVALMAHLGGFVAGFGAGWICAASGWIKPTQDEETLLQVFGTRKR
jgi:membrane associated rhomboid family serine protease